MADDGILKVSTNTVRWVYLLTNILAFAFSVISPPIVIYIVRSEAATYRATVDARLLDSEKNDAQLERQVEQVRKDQGEKMTNIETQLRDIDAKLNRLLGKLSAQPGGGAAGADWEMRR